MRTLLISWSASRGRETYGYNICRLDDTATGKRYRCMGGGYDMTGTVFGEWLQDVAQDRLRTISDQAYYHGGNVNHAGLYGMRLHDDDRVTLDGACGIESMRRIAKVVGVESQWIGNRKGHVVGYTIDGI